MTHLSLDLFLEHFLPILCYEVSSFEQSGFLGSGFKTLIPTEGQQIFFSEGQYFRHHGLSPRPTPL